jgi:hypothetical protein
MPPDVLAPAAIVSGLVVAVLGLASFVGYLVKRAFDDKDRQLAEKDKQIERWAAVYEKSADNTRDTLALVREAKDTLREIRDALPRGGASGGRGTQR